MNSKRTPAHPRDTDAIARLLRDAHADERTDCMIWTGARCHGGYGNVTYKGRTWLAHRLAYTAWHGPIPKGVYVCHRCDNRQCFAIQHLFLGTPQDNTNDMLRKGRGRWRSRLKLKQVIAIKRRLMRGESSGEIARDHGVSVGTIMAIKHGKNWSHVRVPGERRRWARRLNDDRIPIIEFAGAT